MKKQVLDKSLQFIDSWLKLQYQQNEDPGYQVAIAHKGSIVFSSAYGYANLETKDTLTTSNIFRIASHSKTFTATALMQLQEANKLRLDDYLTDFLPWIKEHQDKRWQKVTLRQLMSHGAGVIRDGENADYWQLESPFPDEAQLKTETLKAKLVLDNNVKLKYSNFGYSLLGLVIAEVSGQTYNDYVIEKIINPLNLKNTTPEYEEVLKDRLATGYSRRESDKTRKPIASIDTHTMASATGFCSTAEDLCHFFSAHMVGSEKLLNDESKKEMQRIHYQAYSPSEGYRGGYGLGMDIDFAAKRMVYGHSGGFPGYITLSMFDPKEEIVVVALTNCLGGPAYAIVKGIFSILDYYVDNIPIAKPEHDLSRIEGRYANLWSVADIVVTGDKAVSISPDSWLPFANIETLKRIDDVTYKTENTGSYASEGEFVHFNLEKEEVGTVTYNGATMWPYDVWQEKQKDRNQIG